MKKYFKIVSAFIFSVLFSYVVTGTAYAAPEDIYTYGPMEVWDYYLAPYGADGKIRVMPNYTTFDISEIVDESIPPVYSPSVDEGEDIIVKISGEERYKAWQEKVYEIILKNPYHEAPTAGQSLQFRSSVVNNSITIGKENNIPNGLYEITIMSKDSTIVRTLIEIRKPAPKLKLLGGEPKLGETVSLELEGVVTGLSNPIYEVLLDGKKLAGNFLDYYLIGNRIVISNTELISEGIHTIVVKTEGYHAAEYKFLVGETITSQGQSYKVDAVSSATRGGSGSGDVDAVSGATGSVISADVVFKYDMVANAHILNALGEDTQASTIVLSEWNTFKSRIIGARTKDSKKYADWTDYINAAMQSKINGEYLSFGEFYTNGNYTIRGSASQVKYMLETGRFGDIVEASEVDGKPVNIIIQKAVLHEEVILSYTDDEWKENILRVHVGSTELNKYQYTIADNKIIFTDMRVFTAGKNEIKIEASGYRTYIQSIVLEPSVPKIELEGEPRLNENVTFSLSDQYAANVTGVTLNGKELKTASQVGTNGAAYKIVDNRLTIYAKEFKDTNEQLVIITAYGYEGRIVKFSLLPTVNYEKKLPVIIDVKEDAQKITVTFDEIYTDWKDSISEVKISLLGSVLESNLKFIDNQLIINKDFSSNLFVKLIIKATGYNEIAYDPATVLIETPVWNLKEVETSEQIILGIEKSEINRAYFNKVKEVKLNGSQIEYDLNAEELVLTINRNQYIGLTGEATITVSAENYQDRVIEVFIKTPGVEVPEEPEPGSELIPAPNVGEFMKRSSGDYRLELTQEAYVWLTKLQNITVNEVTYVKNRDYEVDIYNHYITIKSTAFIDKGVHSIVVDSEGYDKITKIVTIEGLPTPTSANKSVTINAGEDVKTLLDSTYLSAYANPSIIKEVTINGIQVAYSLEEVKNFIFTDYYLVIKSEQLPATGTYTIHILAEKYNDLSITLTIK